MTPTKLPKNATPYSRRFLLFLRLTGCRADESRRLRWKNLDMGRGVAVLTKGGRA
jgi:integrase